VKIKDDPEDGQVQEVVHSLVDKVAGQGVASDAKHAFLDQAPAERDQEKPASSAVSDSMQQGAAERVDTQNLEAKVRQVWMGPVSITMIAPLYTAIQGDVCFLHSASGKRCG